MPDQPGPSRWSGAGAAICRISRPAGGDQVVVSIGDIPSDLELEVPLRLTLFAQAASLSRR
jgi:hypothetical protein